MEMRPIGFLILGIICLVLALLVPALRSYLLFSMAVAPLLLLAIGQVVLPRSKRAVSVWFNPVVIDLGEEQIAVAPGTPVGRLSGRDMAYSYFKQWHEFEIVTHRFWLLAVIGLTSLGAVWLS